MKRIFLGLSIFLIPLAGYASNFDLYFMGGSGYSRLSNNTAVSMNEFVVNDYNTDTTGNFGPLLGIGIGHTFSNFNKPFSIGVALSGYYTNYGTVAGTEYPFANDGAYDTLSYKFHAQSYSTLIESRLIYTAYGWQPFGLVGVGYAWNRLFGYSETPVVDPLCAASARQTFEGNTTGSFAYEAGVGVQREIFINDVNHNIHYFLSLDYRYFNFGNGKLGAAATQISSDRLQIANLNTQALTLSLKISA